MKSWSIIKRRARQDANHYKQVGSACRFDDMMRAIYLKLIFRLHATPTRPVARLTLNQPSFERNLLSSLVAAGGPRLWQLLKLRVLVVF